MPIIHHDAVGEFEVFGAAELGEDVTHLVEDDYAHHLPNTTRNEKWHPSFIQKLENLEVKTSSCANVVLRYD